MNGKNSNVLDVSAPLHCEPCIHNRYASCLLALELQDMLVGNSLHEPKELAIDRTLEVEA
jgi:hypothetical protein